MPVATAFHDSVVANGGIAMLNEIEGIGHTTAFPGFVEEMMECFQFIDDAYLTTSIEKYRIESGKVYPNPAKGFINIELVEKGDYLIELIDMNGRIVYSASYSGNQLIRVELDKMESGTYILKQLVDNQMVKNTLISIY
jgi:hypothetical protein